MKLKTNTWKQLIVSLGRSSRHLRCPKIVKNVRDDAETDGRANIRIEILGYFGKGEKIINSKIAPECEGV